MRILIDLGSLLAPKLGPFWDLFGSKIALGRLSASKTLMCTKSYENQYKINKNAPRATPQNDSKSTQVASERQLFRC